MRILASVNFLIVTGLLVVTVWKGVIGDIIVNDLTHGTLLTVLPLIAIGMFVIAMDRG